MMFLSVYSVTLVFLVMGMSLIARYINATSRNLGIHPVLNLTLCKQLWVLLH